MNESKQKGHASAGGKEKMQALVYNAYKDEKFVDLTIEFQEKYFKAHKLVVCSQSSVFNKMCTSGFKEATTAVITLSQDTDLDAIQLQCMIDFFYSFGYCTYSTSSPRPLTTSSVLATSPAPTPSPQPTATTASSTTLWGGPARPTTTSGLFGVAAAAPSSGPFVIVNTSQTTGTSGGNASGGFGTLAYRPTPTGFGTSDASRTTTTWNATSGFGIFASGSATQTTSAPGGGLFGARTQPVPVTSSPTPTQSTTPTPGNLFGASKASSGAAPTGFKPAANSAGWSAVDFHGRKLSSKFHAQMYANADRYDIDGLAAYAKRLYEMSIVDHNEFLDSIVAVYTSTPDSNRGLRDVAAKHMKSQMGAIRDKTGLREIIWEVPGFAADVFELFV